MVYPFMVEDGERIRRKLIEGKVFVAKYWPNIVDDGIHKTEFLLSNQIVSIPCDQRYQEEDMERIVELLEVA